MKPQSEIKDFSDRIIELEELFRRTNDDIFAVHAKRIDLPVFVTIQSKGKRRAYGWCYIVPNWVASDGETRVAYEINIAAETLGRPLEETYVTLVHEMVHLYNCQEGIKDTAARSDRHNKKFGATCDLIGLANKADDYLGWTTHCPWSESSDELHELLETYKQEGRPELLQVNRMDEKASSGNLARVKMVAMVKRVQVVKASQRRKNRTKLNMCVRIVVLQSELQEKSM